MHDDHAGEDRGDAEPQVGHHVEQRQHPGALVGMRLRDDQPDPALEPGPEPDARDRRCRRRAGRARAADTPTSTTGDTDDQREDADEQQACGPRRSAGPGRSRRRRRPARTARGPRARRSATRRACRSARGRASRRSRRSAQTANMTGSAAVAARSQTCRGSDEVRPHARPSAPGSRGAVSGMRATTTAWTASTAMTSEEDQVLRRGQGRDDDRGQERAERGAEPGRRGVGERALARGSGRSSTRRRRPRPPPSTSLRPRGRRAAQGRRRRSRGSTMASAWTAIAASTTGRRPTWSDSRPRVRSESRTATAYVPKTTVVVIAENPHSAW